MRKAFLAGASVAALTFGAFSMFHGAANAAPADQSAQAPAPPQSQSPSMNENGSSGSSAAPAQSPMGNNKTMGTTGSGASTDQNGTMSSGSSSHGAMNADEVKEAQQKLKDEGDYTGQVDGKFGPQTAQAVKQYQQKNGLRQTGHLDRRTLTKLGVGATSGSSTPEGNGHSGGAQMQKPSGSM